MLKNANKFVKRNYKFCVICSFFIIVLVVFILFYTSSTREGFAPKFGPVLDNDVVFCKQLYDLMKNDEVAIDWLSINFTPDIFKAFAPQKKKRIN